MNETTYLPQDELVQRGIEALMTALGPVETMRFLNLPRAERIESVKRHRKWQDGLDQQQFFDQVFGTENH
jgi:hypothetical protein